MSDLPHFLLVLARIGGAVAVAPVFGSRALPMGLRAAVAIALTVAFFPIVPRGVAPSGAALVPAAASEAAVGLAMGFTASLVFAAIQSAGAILDQELGLSLATAFDPSTGEPVALVAQFKVVLAGAAYLLVDGHHLLLSALADSYRAVPMSGLSPDVSGAGALVATVGVALFAAAVKVAAPALVAVFAVTLGSAFLARAVPEANAFVGALPLRLVAGLAVLALGVGAAVSGFAASVRDGDDVVRSVAAWMGGRS